MDTSQRILSDITVFNKYARYIPDHNRRETWEELCDRNMGMHVKKYPYLEKEINEAYVLIRQKKILPSMRSLQFAGLPVELSNNRIYNCAFAKANVVEVFSESMFLLLGGTGLGYSVQTHHVDQLPQVIGPDPKTRRFLIGDSIEGWADAIKVLVESYFYGKRTPNFDYRDIRNKGSLLITSGGRAPGPDPLRICIEHLRQVLNDSVGRKLKPIEVHDMMCHIADAVLSGGIRRAALISLFSADDLDMLSAKSGLWYELNPQRGRANNSVVLLREETTKESFDNIWERIKNSNAGEPGVFWTNSLELGTNPCAEISLNDCQFCNLTEINAHDLENQDDLNYRAKIASFVGTLQAGYNDFHYLRSKWKEVTDEEALIGVGITGIASGKILNLDLELAATVVKEENARVAKLIGINPAARTTTVKPSGTSSLTVGSSSGIHAWHNDFYIRRMRVGKNESLYRYMIEKFPDLIEDCKFKPHLEAVMSFPQKAPPGAILRNESALSLLERVKKFNIDWVKAGHVSGGNYHNVSCTISLQADEWDTTREWMWDNRNYYTGISVLPYDGGTYVQAPFEDCTEDVYNNLCKLLHEINVLDIKEYEDNTSLKENVACAGGTCELTF